MNRSLLTALVFVSSLRIAGANTFTVTNNSDSGVGSLRQAITDANNLAGLDTIKFNIPGGGVHTITLVSALPTVTDPVIIDGSTQDGWNPNTSATTDNADLVIEITSANNKPGLVITGGNSTVRGLVLNRLNTAIDLQTLGGNLIEGNFIGIDPTGTIDEGNIGIGVRATLSSGSNTIGGVTPAARNVIAGNSNNGIQLQTGTNVVQGNFIGLDANGANGIPNGHGIYILNGDENLIGGEVAGAGNVISGNNGHGLNMAGAAANVVKGNLIGTDATGTQALPNTNNGISFGGISSNNTFGGTTLAARNIISGNGGNGLLIGNGSGNVVQGNFIGTDITGMVDLGNSGDGVSFSPGSVNNKIGGGAAGAGNLISGNDGFGINMGGAASGTKVQGNRIGTDVTGANALGNSRVGIRIFISQSNLIGGPNSGEGNLIAFNGEQGIRIEGDSDINNAMLGNSIFSNSGLGIDLANDGPTLNDDDDPDTGENNLQNFPVLETVSNSGGMTHITGRLNSAASTTYRVEFFGNDALDSSGYGGGKTFIGFKDVTTIASGNANFNATFPQIAAGQRVTATATDPDGNTSEFSGSIGQLLNISTRMEVLTGNNALIGGFIIGGTGSKDVVLRALGPTLENFGVTGFVGDPTLDLFDGSGNPIMSNDNWKDSQQAAISATGKAPPNDLEPAIRHSFAPGNYTAIVRGKNNTTGVGLVEAYDMDNSPAITLTNISTRGFVDINQNVMIGGFISGDGIVRVIVRALGPTLSQFGVTNVLADPVLDVRDAQGNSLATNDNWKDSQQAEIQASGKAPPNDNESAIIIVRPAANTTAIVSGKGNTTGNALVEAYILPP